MSRTGDGPVRLARASAPAAAVTTRG
jgi:hypothetical protein